MKGTLNQKKAIKMTKPGCRPITFPQHKGEEGSYWADVPELPGCFASGDTTATLTDRPLTAA